MAKYRHLRNAPITEALIDLRVVLPPNSIERLKELIDGIKDRYPKTQILQHGEFKIRIGEGNSAAQHKVAPLGFLCASADQTKKVQFRGDGFTFNKLKPYEDWARMRDEARDLWSIYAEAIPGDTRIRRVALRFINHLELPAGVPVAEYLTEPLAIPSKLPQGVHEYLNRVVLTHTDLGAMVILTQHLQPKSTADSFTLLLDIDIFRDNANMSGEEAWQLLDKFRDFKNDVFFESITEKTAEMYE